MDNNILFPTVSIQQSALKGNTVKHISKKLGELQGIFEDDEEFKKMDPAQIIYEVDVYAPVPDGTEGGLFFGFTRINPGMVGNEFFMTKGHFHAIGNRAEYYWGTEGIGVLLLMDKNRITKAEFMHSGSLHYIPAHTAHRVVNAGNSQLSFGACWPADAGYDYESIAQHGFSGRIKKINNQPVLVTSS